MGRQKLYHVYTIVYAVEHESYNGWDLKDEDAVFTVLAKSEEQALELAKKHHHPSGRFTYTLKSIRKSTLIK